MNAAPGPTTENLRLASRRNVSFVQYGAVEGTPVVFFQGTPSSRINHPPEPITVELGVRLVVIDRPELDNSTPLGMSKGVAERIPGSRLTILPGQGHLFVYGRLWREILADLVQGETAAPR